MRYVCGNQIVKNLDIDICRQLLELALLYCQKIGNDAFSEVGRGCKYLETLNLVDCSSIGDDAICSIASGCRILKKLHIRRCYEVSFTSVGFFLAARCPVNIILMHLFLFILTFIWLCLNLLWLLLFYILVQIYLNATTSYSSLYIAIVQFSSLPIYECCFFFF